MKNSNDLPNKPFGTIYIKFTSETDCTFSIEITFPEEEDHVRRRKNAENRDLGFKTGRIETNLGAKSTGQADGHAKTDKGKLIAAIQYKRQNKQFVADMVEDKHEAKEFLKMVKEKKIERRQRQVREALKNSIGSGRNKQQNFIRENIVGQQPRVRELNQEKKKLQAVKEKARRGDALKERDRLKEEKSKRSVLQLFKWELLKAKKEVDFSKARDQKEFAEKLRRLVMLGQVYNIFVQMYSNIRAAIKKDIIDRKIRWFTVLLGMKYRFKVKRYGENLDTRMQRRCRQVYNALTIFHCDFAQLRAKRMLADFCRKANAKMDF